MPDTHNPKRQPSLKNSLVNYRLQKACANCRKKRWIAAERGWWQCLDEWHAGGRIKLWAVCDGHEPSVGGSDA